MSPSSLWHSATALTPRAKTSAMSISSSVTLGGSEALGVTRSQDLTMSWTRESLAAGSASMKLVEGRGPIGEEPPTAWDATPAKGRGTFAWRGYVPLMTDSTIDEGPIVWLPPLPLARGWRPRPHLPGPRSATASELVGLRQASSHGARGRVPVRKRLSLYNLRARSKGVGTKQVGHRAASPLPADTQRRPPPVREWRPQSRRLSALPSLDLHKLALGRLSTLGVILKDQKAGRGEEEPIQRLPVAELAPPPLGALHKLNCLSHECTGFPSFRSGTSPQPDSRRKKWKSYSQCFTFDFFSMAVMKPDLFLLGSPLNGMNETERPSRTSKAAQLTGCYKGTNVLP
ncbi:LOW QUALITY PROTEIN: hypothetical protein Cgig2_016585 [Carnegiea gigantea]|uniref:Uncharacterized protein n=1 Tax=Carnegiea gigantea TaxID=171969 RepID=A0A9Q1KZZ8_9CARY|nr:LOW QUALITY PROTEIN: hypothetical protein Cgig2_016585 [Carnegiea gigantea]